MCSTLHIKFDLETNAPINRARDIEECKKAAPTESCLSYGKNIVDNRCGMRKALVIQLQEEQCRTGTKPFDKGSKIVEETKCNNQLDKQYFS